MRKGLTILGASVALSLVTSAFAQLPPDSFKDVPSEHWAYQAVDALRAKGVLVGYPDGLYRGKRTLTRYEFAVALKRALDQVQTIKGDKGDPGAPGAPGAAGPAGPAGVAGPKGDSGMAPEEVAALKKLADEFKAELSNLGVNVNAVNAKLDKLAKDVAALKGEIAGMPKISGGMFVGVRSDRAAGMYVDGDGVVLNNGGMPIAGGDVWRDLVNTPVVLHQFNLNISKSWGEAGSFNATVVNSNYLDYLHGRAGYQTGALVNTKPIQVTYLDKLVLDAPFGAMGQNGNLTLGRFGFALTPLTLSKVSVDSYLTNPLVDDGQLRIDGFNYKTGLGSVGVNAFAGQTSRATGVDGFTAPFAGTSTAAIFVPVDGKLDRPLAQGDGIGRLIVDQVAGVEAKLPLNIAGGAHLGVRATLATGDGGVGFTNVQTLGADAGVKLGETVSFTGEWAKTNTGTGRLGSVNVHENNAFTGNLALGTVLGVNLSAGYKYIDPLFYAPGYWGKIGNWYNPTNVQGPSVRLNKDLTPKMGLTLGGDYVFAARDRAAAYSLGKDDEIYRALAGLRWDVSESLTASVDWEGVYWKIQGAHGAIGTAATKVHPTEHYITLGAGYKWNDAANIKLGYQLGSFDGHGFLSAGGGLGAYNYNAFTSTVNVKF